MDGTSAEGQGSQADSGIADVNGIPLSELYMPFESLGNNCEFGIVQRLTGYDPPGLFRNVGFLNVDAIVSTIERNLEGMFDEGLYNYILPDGWPDWRLDCMRYGFGFHTSIPAKLDRDSDEWRKKAKDTIAAFRFLKRLFQDELKSGERTFVFRFIAPLPLETIQKFLKAIRKHGPGWLLYVKEDANFPGGFVERIEEGLMIGAIDRLSNENPPQINAKAWEHIARRVIEIRQEAEKDA
jgi:hypothetical protein